MEKPVQRSVSPPSKNSLQYHNLKRAEIVVVQLLLQQDNFLIAYESLDQTWMISLHVCKNMSFPFGLPLLAARFYLPFPKGMKRILEVTPPKLQHGPSSFLPALSLRIKEEESVGWQAPILFLFLIWTYWCHERKPTVCKITSLVPTFSIFFTTQSSEWRQKRKTKQFSH